MEAEDEGVGSKLVVPLAPPRPCLTNALSNEHFRSDRNFLDPSIEVPGLVTELITYRTTCPTNTLVRTVFPEEFVVRWTRREGAEEACRWPANAWSRVNAPLGPVALYCLSISPSVCLYVCLSSGCSLVSSQQAVGPSGRVYSRILSVGGIRGSTMEILCGSGLASTNIGRCSWSMGLELGALVRRCTPPGDCPTAQQEPRPQRFTGDGG